MPEDDGDPGLAECAVAMAPLMVTLTGCLEASAVVDGSCTVRLETATFSRHIELRHEAALAARLLGLLCCDVLVQGWLHADHDAGRYVIEITDVRLLETPVGASRDRARAGPRPGV